MSGLKFSFMAGSAEILEDMGVVGGSVIDEVPECEEGILGTVVARNNC